jgi:transposase InsO family protein
MNDKSRASSAVKKSPPPPEGGGGGRPKTSNRFPFEFKRRAVGLFLEEGFTRGAIAQELGIAIPTLDRWVDRYRQFGEAGLHDQPTGPHPDQAKLSPAVTERIVEIKKENPSFGVKRISQWLRRVFFLEASAETVRSRLHEAQLMNKPVAPKRRNMTRPRFFERATPNQMWQSDIFTFRLGGKYAYLVAFLDDYSRFVTAADLFRSPTAAAVIEVYRQGVGEFQPPKEMLTDNGRQYTTWRGTSRFEAELKKDRVAHFKSRPHHPMTLGKIERFWATLWQEFLERAQFESFEAARERIKLWIKYYNHRRPHQGIEGLCPADRFFEIQSELRKTMEAGIKENILEMALRGQPRAPFYMVGRMEGQSVVLRAEKGKLKLELSDPKNQTTQELVYDLAKPQDHEHSQNIAAQTPTDNQLPGHRESPGGVGGLDREVQTGGSMSATQDQLDHLPAMATTGDGGDAPGIGEPGQPEQRRSLKPAFAGTAAQTAAQPLSAESVGTAGTTPERSCQSGSFVPQIQLNEPITDRSAGSRASHAHPSSASGSDHCAASRPPTGHLPPALLPMGETGVAGIAQCAGGPTEGTPQESTGPGETPAPGSGGTTPETGARLSAERETAPTD